MGELGAIAAADRSTATAVRADVSAGQPPGASDATIARTAVAVAETTVPSRATAERLPLRVRLRGLRADLPWDGSVQVQLEGAYKTFDGSSGGPCEGTREFSVLTDLAADPTCRTWVTGSARHYRAADVRRQGALDLTQELILDVFPRAILKGKVTTSRGEPVHAHVAAFAMRDGQPTDEELATSPTLLGSEFELLVPAGTPVLVVAAASDRDPFSMAWYSTPEALRSDLLAQGVQATATFEHDTDLGTLVLPDAEQLQGRVLHADGTPAGGVLVTAGPPGLTALPLLTGFGADTESRVHFDGSPILTPETPVFSHPQDGRFALPALPGALLRVRVAGLSDSYQAKRPLLPLHLAQPGPPVVTSARWIELRLPPAQLVRVVDAGRPVPGAMVELGGATREPRPGPFPTGPSGELQLLMTDEPLRAIGAGRRSAWRRPPTDGSPLVLELDETLGELHLDLGAAGVGQRVHVAWRQDDDHGEQDLFRRNAAEPFVCQLPLGRAQLRVTASTQEAAWLLPLDTTVEVTTTPQTAMLPVQCGGRISVSVRDDGGRFARGRCWLSDARGVEQPLRFEVHNGLGHSIAASQPGELLPQGPNTSAELLLPGNYTILVEAGGHRFERQPVTITARATTEVHLRLP